MRTNVGPKDIFVCLGLTGDELVFDVQAQYLLDSIAHDVAEPRRAAALPS